jgi:glycosyltransferase involved in cell wall biosynthesis
VTIEAEAMRFSLVLATIGRVEEVRRLLDSLHAQTYQDFELIVVDQNPDDRLKPILAMYKEEFSILHLRSESKGLSRARNLGLKYVSGDVLVFPDDDCWYPAGLLEQVASFFANNPEMDILTGRTTDVGGKTVLGRFGDKPLPLDRVSLWAHAPSATTFVRRENAQEAQVTWFDEDLGVGAGTAWGAGEETDYLLQLWKRGALIYYDPDLMVFHPEHVPPYTDQAIRKAYNYGCGMGYVLKKHRMPLWFKAKWLIRPLGGAVLSLVGLRPRKAGFRWNTFRGRLRGLLS